MESKKYFIVPDYDGIAYIFQSSSEAALERLVGHFKKRFKVDFTIEDLLSYEVEYNG